MEARIKTKPKSSEWAPGEGHQPRQTSEPAVRRRDVRAGEKMEKPRGAHTGTWGPKPALSGAAWSGRGSCKVGPVGAAAGRAQAPPGAATWGSAPMCFVCARGDPRCAAPSGRTGRRPGDTCQTLMRGGLGCLGPAEADGPPPCPCASSQALRSQQPRGSSPPRTRLWDRG